MTKPLTISTLSSAATESLAAMETAEQVRRRAGGKPIRGAVLYSTVGYDVVRLQAELRAALPGIPFLGATECLGVGSSGGAFTRGRAVTGLFLLGEGFRFGVASAKKHGDPRGLGEQLATRALEQAGIPAAKARFAIIHPTPGDEESILAGAYGKLDHQTAIIGGSAADDDLSGRWRVFTHDFVSHDGVALAVCDWPWKLAINYQSGYLPTTRRGKVTRSEGRTLLEIDGRPAAEVYDSWLGGDLKPFLEKGGNVLATTTMRPLGVTRGLFGGIQAYVLAHPERVLAEQKALTLFTRIKEGEEVVMMSSSPEALVARAANVARLALSRAGLKPEQIVGGLLVYCGGCALAIKDQMPQMLTDFDKVVAGAPYVGHFPFGEQGCVLPRHVDHGNLMANVLLLSAE